jgi:hypothetical protein
MSRAAAWSGIVLALISLGSALLGKEPGTIRIFHGLAGVVLLQTGAKALRTRTGWVPTP